MRALAPDKYGDNNTAVQVPRKGEYYCCRARTVPQDGEEEEERGERGRHGGQREVVKPFGVRQPAAGCEGIDAEGAASATATVRINSLHRVVMQSDGKCQDALEARQRQLRRKRDRRWLSVIRRDRPQGEKNQGSSKNAVSARA